MTNEFERSSSALLDHLHAQMEERRLCAAGQTAEEIIRRFPSLDIAQEYSEIRNALGEAEAQMPEIYDEDVLERCVQVLNFAADYQPALDILATLPPAPPENLICNVENQKTGTVFRLEWTPVHEPFITYKVFRSEQEYSMDAPDAGCIAENLSEPSFIDCDVIPGKRYYYTVFAVRMDHCSVPPVTKSVLWIPEINEKTLKCSLDDCTACFRWTLPADAGSVRVIYTKGGEDPPTEPVNAHSVLLEGYTESADFENLEAGVCSAFRFQCGYLVGDTMIYSSGIVRKLIPTPDPCEIHLQDAVIRSEEVLLKWTPSDCSQRLSVHLLNPDNADLIRTQPLTEDLLRSVSEKQLADAATDETDSLCIPLQRNQLRQYAAVLLRGNKYALCTVFEAAGSERAVLDPDSFRLERGTFFASLKSVPAALSAIHYIIYSTDDPWEQPPMPTEREIRSGRMNAVTRQRYLAGNKLCIQQVPVGYFWFCMIGELRINKKQVFTEADVHLIENPKPFTVKYWIKKHRGAAPVITVETLAEQLPPLHVVYQTDSQSPTNLYDPNVRIIRTFDFVKTDGVKKYIFRLEPTDMQNVPPNAVLRLMIETEFIQRYNLIPM